MKKSPLSRITANIGIKLLSVVIAILIWYFAVYSDDPVTTVSFTVHIDVENESYIQNGKQVYYIDDEYKTVTVYVKGNQSKVKNLTENSITVTADLTQIVDLERDPVMVPLTATCKGFDSSAITLSRTTIPIEIEEISSKDLPITVLTGETTPAKDYEIGSMKPNPETITVNGPESVISQIDSVVAYIDVTNMSGSGVKTANLVYIDKEQNTISEETINDDITVEGGVTNVVVNVELWRKQSGVTFNVNYSGTPAEGYQVYSITTSPDEVTLAGNTDALTELAQNENTITIPAEWINVDGKTSDFTQTCDITELLPENMKIASSMNDTIDVTVKILPTESKEITYDVDKIIALNLAQDETILYTNPTISLRIKSTGGDLAALTEDNIKVELELSGLVEGEHSKDVTVTLPAGYALVDTVEVKFTLKKNS